MRRSPWLVAAMLLIATPLLAGCAEPGAPAAPGTGPDEGGADDAPGADAAGREPAGDGGGAADPGLRPTEEVPSSSPSESAEGGATTVLEFAYDGRTETYGWVVADGRAQGAGMDETEENATWEIPFNGTPVQLDVTLSWAADSPLTENLTLQLFALHNASWAPVDGYAIAGTSPLQVTWNFTGFDDLPLAVHVTSEQWVEQGDDGVLVAAPQAFHVDGRLTFHPADG